MRCRSPSRPRRSPSLRDLDARKIDVVILLTGVGTRTLAAACVDVALFTSATQVHHLIEVAATDDRIAALRAGLTRGVVGSIGALCSQALRAAGLAVDLEPSHPKMGLLVAEVLRAAPVILEAKRR